MTEPDSKTSETSTTEEALVESQAPASSIETVDSESAGAAAVTVAESVAAWQSQWRVRESECGRAGGSGRDRGRAVERRVQRPWQRPSQKPSVAETETVAATVTVSAAESVGAPLTEAEAESGTETVVGEAETVSGEVAAAEAQADTVAGDAAPGVSTESSAGDVEAEGAGKKKRRRRRKKKGAQAGASDAPPDAKSMHHHAPFLHLFSGGATRKHAFSVGEEIAGRVERVEHGTVIVDLFGKATAIADVDEPRELPTIIHEV